MPEVSLNHIIGTIALIGLVITAGLSYNIVGSYIGSEIRKQQLEQISENVALNFAEVTNLIKFMTYAENPIMKTINLPQDLSNRAYTIQLIQNQQEAHIRTYLTTNPNIQATSPIPFNIDEDILVLYTDEEIDHIEVGNEPTIIACKATVHGGNNIVVWAQPTWEETDEGFPEFSVTIGLGWIVDNSNNQEGA